MGDVLQKTTRILGLTQLPTSGAHPQTDGLAERLNRTLKEMLSKIVTKEGKDWDELLEPVLFCLPIELHLIHLQVRQHFHCCMVEILGFLQVWIFINQSFHYQQKRVSMPRSYSKS